MEKYIIARTAKGWTVTRKEGKVILKVIIPLEAAANEEAVEKLIHENGIFGSESNE